MSKEANPPLDEAPIRQLVEEFAAAVRAKDVDKAMAPYAPDVLSFEVIKPLQIQGLDAARKRTEEWFSSFQGPIAFENHDLHITMGTDVAFCHSLHRVQGTQTDGEPLEMWWRTTLCFRKIENQWKVTHQHASVPFDSKSRRASLDLQP